jgi:SNF2 family DNA or RNA helicase
MAKKEDLDLEQNCSICFDELSNPSLTSCGHIFCKECLEMCLQVKKLCPMCKTDLTGKEIYLIDSKKDEEKNPEEENPLIKKYGSKLGKLVSLVRTLITDDNNRIIIFSQWDRMLNLIGKTLSENGVANSFVKGNVWSRNSAISKFKLGKDSTGEDNKVIMLSLSNSASGTNLTEATHIIFVEPINSKHEEVKAIESQAIGRACRLGQKNKVKVIRILTQNTIEQEIYDSIYSKNKDNIKRTIMIDDGDLNHNLIV